METHVKVLVSKSFKCDRSLGNFHWSPSLSLNICSLRLDIQILAKRNMVSTLTLDQKMSPSWPRDHETLPYLLEIRSDSF